MANQNSNSSDLDGGSADGGVTTMESMETGGTGDVPINSYQVIRLNHQDRMSSAFESMLCDEMFCDVTIICNGQAVKAHRVILAAASSYFKEIFQHIPFGFCPIVFLKNFTNEDLNNILEFIYKGILVIPSDRIQSLIDSAKSLGIVGLATLQMNINDNNQNNNGNLSIIKNIITQNDDDDGGDDDDNDNDNDYNNIVNDKNIDISSSSATINQNNSNTTNNNNRLHTGRKKRGRKRKLPISNDNNKPVVVNNNNNSNDDLSTAITTTITTIVTNPVKPINDNDNNQFNNGLLLGGKLLRNRNSQQSTTEKKSSISNNNCDQHQHHDGQISDNKNNNNSNSSSTSNTKNNKITKSKLRSWSQQIWQKNLATLRSSTKNTNVLPSCGSSSSSSSSSDSVDHDQSSNDNQNVVGVGSIISETTSKANDTKILKTTPANVDIKYEIPEGNLIRVEPRRGRPPKIKQTSTSFTTIQNQQVPRLSPLVLSTKSTKKLTNGTVNGHNGAVNGNSKAVGQQKSIKRGRGRPPLLKQDPYLREGALSNPKFLSNIAKSSSFTAASNTLTDVAATIVVPVQCSTSSLMTTNNNDNQNMKTIIPKQENIDDDDDDDGGDDNELTITNGTANIIDNNPKKQNNNNIGNDH
ncbi:btb/poz domain containing protein [Dermatophagoides farinae]|uniref:Btb/poz domain containing protein n=1 Tax=Dermatophagoides farinae TaxID=6954 RepID=A0A9D4NVA1_DERFA|nr:btb/poz domain containing protein [Dermatophagoides farinae]